MAKESDKVLETASTGSAIRLLCLPYAGGGAVAVFRSWRGQLAPVAEVCPLELPGRGARMAEQPFRRVRELAVNLASGVEAYGGEPLAVLGHSLGALLAFEMVRELRRRGMPSPVHLFVSSRRGPRLPEIDPALRDLPDGAFVEQMQRRYHAIPDEVLREPELLQMLLPTLRADFEMLETYEYADEQPLDCPITAIGGLDDTRAPLEALEAWAGETTGPFQLKRFPGGHFYFRQANTALVELVKRALEGGSAVPQAS